jgi:hypothetical protein
MDLAKILSQLHLERDQLDEAIWILERLVSAQGRRRGRPPAWMTQVAAKCRGRPPGSENKSKPLEGATENKLEPVIIRERPLTP